jgi:hypothetical protein
MKFFFGLLIASFLFSCNEEGPKPDNRPRLVTKDSPLVKTDSVNPYAPVDVSPMDISYFPVDYPIEHMYNRTTRPLVARVIYSRPHRQGRQVFGALLKYGEPWRLGANEATEIEFFQPVEIQGRQISKGKYTIYVIPFDGRWTVVLNTNTDVWGLVPDPAKDVHKIDIPIQKTNNPVEYFSMVFQDSEQGADLVMAWDSIIAKLPIHLK